MNQSFLNVQIGPVQEFIAQAGITRDLWSEGNVLSLLTAADIRELIACEGGLILSSPKCQPLLDDPADWHKHADHTSAELVTSTC